MDSNRLKKLKLYSSLAGTSILSIGTTNADIIYSDLSPDSIATGNNNATSEYFFVDLDNDGINDFQVGMYNAQTSASRTNTWNGVWASGINTSTMATGKNAIAYSGTSFSTNIQSALTTGDIIGASKNFYYYGVLGVQSYYSNGGGGYGSFGNFANQGDKYLGLQFYIGGNLHYGWAQVSVNASNLGYKLMDYAYQDCPNFPIKAGATSGTSYLTKSINVTGCDSVDVLGTKYFNSTTIYDTINVGVNCDSVDIYNITINYSASGSQDLANCDSVVYNGSTYKNSTIVMDTLVAGALSGCDSITFTNITVYNKASFMQDFTSCDSLVYNGNTYTSSATLIDTVLGGSSSGCDSIVTINIVVNESKVTSETATILEGESIVLGGTNQTTAGVYVDSLMTSTGCDSIISTTLTVNPNGFSKINTLNVKVFPNPSNGLFTLDLSGVNSSKLSYVVIDNVGRIVKKEDNINTNNFSNIDLNNLEVGVYFLKMESENKSVIIKLIKN